MSRGQEFVVAVHKVYTRLHEFPPSWTSCLIVIKIYGNEVRLKALLLRFALRQHLH